MNTTPAHYQASLKLLLRKEDEFLLLQDTYKSLLDLPGGRINADEFSVPIEEILRREVTEELGSEITYEIKEPLFQFRRFHTPSNMPVLLTVYEGIYTSGEIILSDEHESYQWVHKQDALFPPERYFTEEEYVAFKQYFSSSH